MSTSGNFRLGGRRAYAHLPLNRLCLVIFLHGLVVTLAAVACIGRAVGIDLALDASFVPGANFGSLRKGGVSVCASGLLLQSRRIDNVARAKVVAIRLGKCWGRDDGQQTHDGQKLLQLTSPVIFLDFELIRRVEVELGDTGEIDPRSADTIKMRFRELNSCL